jgi:hypothetical protein
MIKRMMPMISPFWNYLRQREQLWMLGYGQIRNKIKAAMVFKSAHLAFVD